jgi:hypothetical protein
VNDLKYIKFGGIALLLFGMVIAMTGIVCADQGVYATPETQSLSTVTTADVVGLAMETDAGVWTLTNDPVVLNTYNFVDPEYTFADPATFSFIQAILQSAGGSIHGYQLPEGYWQVTQINVPQSLLNEQIPGFGETWQDEIDNWNEFEMISPVLITGKGIHDGALDPGQVQYTTAYDANIVAQAGHTVLTKSMNIDTRNKVIGQSNLNAQTALTYIATADGGNVVGSENLMLDGAGSATSAAGRILCPFAASPNSIIPAYCNIIQAGSTYDLTVGSVTTVANDKFVSNDASLPVTLNYHINVKPYGTSQGQIPARGGTSAYMKSHLLKHVLSAT